MLIMVACSAINQMEIYLSWRPGNEPGFQLEVYSSQAKIDAMTSSYNSYINHD